MTLPPLTGRGDLVFLAVAGPLAFAAYLGLVTAGTYAIAEPSRFGMVFNAMALGLVEGRFDIDPGVIRFEAFFHEGRTYAYFGILSALVRLPLMPFVDLATTDVARPLTAIAAALAATFQAQATLRATRRDDGVRAAWLRALLVTLPFVSGPQVYLLGTVDMYGEAALWGLCWASATVAAAVHLALRDGRAPTRLHAAIAAAAGACLLARVSVGTGACALAAVVVLARLWTESGADGRRPVRWRHLARPLLASLIAGGVPVGFALFVNDARWGNPFEFVDLRRQLIVQELHPTFLPRLAEQGAVNIERVWFGLQYYFAPVWSFPTADGAARFETWMRVWLHGAEPPASTPLFTDPLVVVLAVVGAAAIVRGRLPRGATVAWAAGAGALSIPVAVVMGAVYMTLRYRVDIQPLLLWLAVAGARRTMANPPRRLMAIAAALLFAASVLGTAVMYVVYTQSPAEPVYPTVDPIRQMYWAVSKFLRG